MASAYLVTVGLPVSITRTAAIVAAGIGADRGRSDRERRIRAVRCKAVTGVISAYAATTSKSRCLFGCDDHGCFGPIDFPSTPLIGVEKTIRQTNTSCCRPNLDPGFLHGLTGLLCKNPLFMGNVHLESALYTTKVYLSSLRYRIFKDTLVNLIESPILDSGLDVRGRDGYPKRRRDLVFQMRKTPDEILFVHDQNRIEALLC